MTDQSSHLFVLTLAKLPAHKSHPTRYISFALRGNLVHRILVVDDFKPWLDAACEIIETQPELQVIAQAGDGGEAVQLATNLNATWLCSILGCRDSMA
jgi:hypothetical protein